MVPGDARRASDEDREQAATRLRDACASGRLSLDELEKRLDQTYGAITVAELDLVVRDLPVPPEPPEPPSLLSGPGEDDEKLRRRILRKHRSDLKAHAASYVGVNGGLVGIWLATGGDSYFWPRWPLLGWGIGLFIHGSTALFGVNVDEEVERLKRREARAAERASRRSGKRFECPSCGSDLHPRGSVFVCRSCGRAIEADLLAPAVPLSSSPPASELPAPAPATAQRWVVVMFTDVVESTKLAEALGDDGWSRVRARHDTNVREAIAATNGTEIGNQGDGFVIRFDDAGDALSCAVDIQKRFDHAREHAGFAPQVRIGIHAGHALERDGEVVGTVMNLASRVMGEAGADEIWVTEPVSDLCPARFRYRDKGLRTLKGIERPRHLLEVDWR